MTLTGHLVQSIAVLFMITLVAVWLLAPPAAIEARFGHNECRRLALTDPATGKPIVGAEDLGYRADGDMLVFTAHDRRDPEKPGGGLYSIPIWALNGSTPKVHRLYGGRGGQFRPHGLAVSRDGRQLALVNRPSDGPVEILTGPVTRDYWRITSRMTDRRLCRANDLAFDPFGNRRLQVTIDRADCTPSLRDLLPFIATGTRLSTRGGRDAAFVLEQRNLSFPNGITDGAIAETRGSRLRMTKGRVIDLPGGPDNLTRTTGGDIIAAVHPRLFHVFLGLNGYYDHIPSRIVRVEPDTGTVEVLFDDPDGTLFSGASAAILAGDQLIAGSAIDQGLLVCGSGF